METKRPWRGGRRALARLGLAGAAWLALGTPAALAKDPVYTSAELALSGHDAVAYFREGKPVKGRAEHETHWAGARWRFASAANRDAFTQSPERYAPQYGGYCAYAVSRNYTASADPAAWRIVGGKLYVNYSKAVQATWAQDIPGNIERADRNWPAVLAK